MYILEGDNLYLVTQLENIGEVRTIISMYRIKNTEVFEEDSEGRYWLKIYTWEKFNIKTEQFEDDPNNTNKMIIDGQEYTPEFGMVIIKEKVDNTNKLLEEINSETNDTLTKINLLGKTMIQIENDMALIINTLNTLIH